MRPRTFAQAALLVALFFSAHAQAAEGTEASADYDCVIEPHIVVDLSSRIDGIVESIEVERGELIEKDQLLVRLEAGVERAAVAEAKVRAEAQSEILAGLVSVEFAQRRNERISELHRSQNVSTDQLDEFKTQYELSLLQLERARENQKIAQLELRQAQEILNRHTLRSPIRGIVVQRYLAPGEAVEEQPIMRIAQIDPLRVEVIVPVKAFGSIQIGQRAIMRPESPMEGKYEATVTVVDGVADASSGTFRVRLGLPNEDYSLPSGLRCQVSFLPMDKSPDAELMAEPTPQESNKDVLEQAGVPPYELLKADAALIEPDAQACQTIGPFVDTADAGRIMTALDKQATQLRVREEIRESVKSYLLLAVAQPSLEASRGLTDKLQAAGFNDFYLYPGGPYKGRISLGVHTNREYSAERKAQLNELGIESEMVPRMETHSRFWLDVRLLPQVSELDLSAATTVSGDMSFVASPCGTIADHALSGQKIAGHTELR